MVDPFCIEGPTVLEVALIASFTVAVNDVMVSLMVDSTVVAQSQMNDEMSPSNLSLIYRGEVVSEAQIMVVMTSESNTTIPAKHL